MSLNKRCPQCNGTHVQLSDERRHHGCLWFLILGFYYVAFVFFKWILGIIVFFAFDIWMAIIMAILGRRYTFKSRILFRNKVRTYYCHDCGHNFRI